MEAVHCDKTSEQELGYNCVAHAADPGNTERWWQPVPGPPHTYWPPGVPDDSLHPDTFEAAFSSLGYQPCPDGSLESGWEKVAIFVGDGGLFSHVARQLENGLWTSKLGPFEDISHPLYELEGPEPAYGTVDRFMRRERARTP